jgi:adenylosuccinate synthase
MITIVVGSQYGGEGKGKICAFLGARDQPELVCRTGGVNSSHTVVSGAAQHRLRMVPASAVHHQSKIIYGAGSLLHIQTLFDEMRALGISADDVIIDERAGIVTEECISAQRADPRYEKLGSTLTGTGYATAQRAQRRLPLAREFNVLRPFMKDVPKYLHTALLANQRVLVEGHQGSGLSNYHGDYPFTSSRDCIAAALLSELGVGLAHPSEVVLVVKLFPTRNHGGALPHEIGVKEAEQYGIFEQGGGSWGIADKRRRVGTLDHNTVKRAIMLNTPSYLALTGLDYSFPNLRGARAAADLTPEAISLLKTLNRALGVHIGLVSTGPDTDHLIDLRAAHMRQQPRQASII